MNELCLYSMVAAFDNTICNTIHSLKYQLTEVVFRWAAIIEH